MLPELSARSLDAFAWIDRLRNEEISRTREEAARQQAFRITR